MPMIAEKPLMLTSVDGQETFCFFWGQASPFSSWRASHFEIDGIAYSSGEQRMMHCKAALFGDQTQASAIMATPSPWTQKALGRAISGYDEEVWVRERLAMMIELVWHKAQSDRRSRRICSRRGTRRSWRRLPKTRCGGLGFAPTTRTLWTARNERGKICWGRRGRSRAR